MKHLTSAINCRRKASLVCITFVPRRLDIEAIEKHIRRQLMRDTNHSELIEISIRHPLAAEGKQKKRARDQRRSKKKRNEQHQNSI